MDKIKLDKRELNILIKEVQMFTTKKFGIELSEVQASGLIDFILSKTEARIYNQVAFETRYNIHQEFMHLLGLNKSLPN